MKGETVMGIKVYNPYTPVSYTHLNEEQGYLPKVIFRIFEAPMEFIISLINIHLRK